MSNMAAVSRGILSAGRLRAATHCCRSIVLPSNECDLASTSGRTFSSSSSGEELQALRQSLLKGALSHVKERGWTSGALIAAARDLKLSPAVMGVLPRGEGELVEHFIDDCNKRCVELLEAQKQDLQSLPLDERVSKALQIRLELVTPYVDSWPQALAVAARPANSQHSLKLLFNMVDDIWAALGDDSTDLTWYSKRAVLAGVYTSTSLYMLTDYSPGFKDTWGALRRRVAEGLALDASVQRVVHTATSAAASAPPPPSSSAASAAPAPPSPDAAGASASASAPAAASAAAAEGVGEASTPPTQAATPGGSATA